MISKIANFMLGILLGVFILWGLVVLSYLIYRFFFSL